MDALARGTTKSWETLTWLTVAIAALVVAANIGVGVVLIVNSVSAPPIRLPTDALLGYDLLIVLSVVVAGAWRTRSRAAVRAAHVEESAIFGHPLMRERDPMRMLAAVGYMVVLFVVVRQIGHPNVGEVLGAVAVALVPPVVVALWIRAVLEVRSQLRALPPVVPRPKKTKSSQHELADLRFLSPNTEAAATNTTTPDTTRAE
jgi:hypothetical protein